MTIKLGSSTINTIKLGSTTVTKVALGSTTVFPGGAPPPSGTLLEGFENTPSTGGPAWNPVSPIDYAGLSTPTVTRTSSHVTQGTFSWRIQGIIATLPGLGVDSTDVTGVLTTSSTIKLDVFVQTINALDAIYFQISDGDTQPDATSIAGATGAFTLTVDTTGIVNYDNLSFLLTAMGSGFAPISGAVDYYVDNMRAE